MNLKRNRKGFTLLEILIVIVILGVIAGLAIPVFTSNIQKSRAQEALASLAATRNALVLYYATTGNQSYVGATLANIGYDPNLVVGGQVHNFTYALSSLAATTFLITATCPVATCGAGTNTVTLNQAGVTTRTGVFV